MSAWIVDRVHIDCMVTALHPSTQEEGDKLGRLLWIENLRSVTYRYPGDKSNDRPGPNGLGDREIRSYTWTRREVPDLWILAAAHCLSYQSCEHDGWEASEAKQIVDRIEGELGPVYGDRFGRRYGVPCSAENPPWGINAAALAELAGATGEAAS